MSNPSQVESARQTYAAVLRALDAAVRWQKQETAQAESEYAQTIQSAETARKQTEEAAATARADGTKRADKIRTLVEDTVKRGVDLHTHANLDQNPPPSLSAPRALFPTLPPNQALQRFADQATLSYNNLQSKLTELEQARRENFFETRRFIIAGAVLVGVALVILVILAMRR